MDRVLLIVDDIQYCRHLEMTLRKVGFDVESVNNEFNLNETLLTFNPDFIICKGNSNRLSALNVGKRLKESSTKSPAKVILVFPDDLQVGSDELIKMKMDMLLFEPISTLKLAMSLFSLAGGDLEFARSKLLRFAITDSQFRSYEQQLLRSAGITLDSEIETVSEMRQFAPSPPSETAKESEMIHVKGGDGQQGPTEALLVSGKQEEASGPPPDTDQALEGVKPGSIGEGLKEEVRQMAEELPLRIDSYNHAINKVDQNLKTGLKKRQTKAAGNRLRKDLMAEEKADKMPSEELDAERMKFARALFKK